MNWIAVHETMMVNLEHVSAVMEELDGLTKIFVDLGEGIESVSCQIPYETVCMILRGRDGAKHEQTSLLRQLAQNQHYQTP